MIRSDVAGDAGPDTGVVLVALGDSITEGWGGITTGGYLERMRTDTNWQERMRLLQPGIWLIHLGVNDERQKIPTAQFDANLEGIVDTLVTTYAAAPASIVVATPCYDYFPGALDFLASYVQEIVRVIDTRGLRTGPDFFDAYAHDLARYYGEDPVHPNVEGMRLMADLWAERIEGLRASGGEQ